MDTSLPDGVRRMFEDAGIDLDTPTVVQVNGNATIEPTKSADPVTAEPVTAEPVAQCATEPEPDTSQPTGGSDALVTTTEPTDYIEPTWAAYLFHVWDRLGTRAPNAVLLTGPRGTGKTLAAEVYAARRKRSLLVCNCNPEMTAESLLGTPRLDLKAAGGDYWQPGPIMLAAQHNAVLLLDEFNALGTASQVALNPLADRAGKGGVFIPYIGARLSWSNPRIICAVNEGYAGTRDIQTALRDRLETMHATYLEPSQEQALLCTRTGVDPVLAEAAVKAATAIRAAARGESGEMPLDFDLSPRALLSWCNRINAGQDCQVAWRESVIGRIGWAFRTESTRAAVEQISKAAGFLTDDAS